MSTVLMGWMARLRAESGRSIATSVAASVVRTQLILLPPCGEQGATHLNIYVHSCKALSLFKHYLALFTSFIEFKLP